MVLKHIKENEMFPLSYSLIALGGRSDFTCIMNTF